MIEGQEGVTWQQWVGLARACEDHGLQGLFRSDHYASVEGLRDRGSLDAWATLTALAARTERIRLGTMVSPATFRHPSELAKVVTTADHVSGGRVELGLGAGWHELEHRTYGFPFPDTGTRMDLLAEQLEIVCRSWRHDTFDLEGEHYTLEDCRALPKPVQPGGPTLIVGGMAGPRSCRLAATWADEYNTVFPTPEQAARRREQVAAAWEAADRDPQGLRFSVMTGCAVGTDAADLRQRAAHTMTFTGDDDGGDPDAWLARQREGGWVTGTVEQVVDQLHELGQVGVTRVMLQHRAHDDLEAVELLGEVARQVGSAS